MIKEESNCVGCALPCVYERCPYYRVKVHYCVKCGEQADIKMDGDTFCSNCAERLIDEEVAALSFKEKCELLNIEKENLY